MSQFCQPSTILPSANALCVHGEFGPAKTSHFPYRGRDRKWLRIAKRYAVREDLPKQERKGRQHAFFSSSRCRHPRITAARNAVDPEFVPHFPSCTFTNRGK